MSNPAFDVTDEQIRLCVAAWLMCGTTFSDEQRVEISRLYAGGFAGFRSSKIGAIRLIGKETWVVTDKGNKMLEDI